MEAKPLYDDPLDRQIDEIEIILRREDRSLAKRLRKLERSRTRNEVAVFSLLTVSAVLLAIALATTSLAAGSAGVAAYLASFLVDNRYQRMLSGPSADGTRRATRR